MEFLVHREKKEKQACWGPIQAPKGARAFQVPKETGEPPDGLASLAEREPREMLGLKDPRASQDSQDPQVHLGQLSLARKETKVLLAQEEIQVSQVPLDLQEVS